MLKILIILLYISISPNLQNYTSIALEFYHLACLDKSTKVFVPRLIKWFPPNEPFIKLKLVVFCEIAQVCEFAVSL